MLRTLPPSYRLEEASGPFGRIIKVAFSIDLIPAAEEVVTFELHLEGKFPFQAPKLYCRTSFTKPSFADGRDLLKDVMLINWTPSLTLSDIVRRLPEFINASVVNVPLLDPLEIGQFHLGQPISLATWDFQLHMGIFRCKEVDSASKSDQFMAVSQSVIIQLEPCTQHPEYGYMLSWASLYSLENIQRQKRDPNRLTFKWKQMGDEPAYQQTLLMPEAEACISLISSNMRDLGVLVKKRNPIATLNEEEVTAKSVKKVHINEILEAIAVYESNFEANLSLFMINSLMELYQQAIEYFSALNDPRYDIFLDKLHTMLSNDTVLTLLRSKSQEEVKSDHPTHHILMEDGPSQANPASHEAPHQIPAEVLYESFPQPPQKSSMLQSVELPKPQEAAAIDFEEEFKNDELVPEHPNIASELSKSDAISQEVQMFDLADAEAIDIEAPFIEENKQVEPNLQAHTEASKQIEEFVSNEKVDLQEQPQSLQELPDEFKPLEIEESQPLSQEDQHLIHRDQQPSVEEELRLVASEEQQEDSEASQPKVQEDQQLNDPEEQHVEAADQS